MPDLVFVDVALPGMSGLELSAKIREHNRNTIIVILSGYMEFDYAQKGDEHRRFNIFSETSAYSRKPDRNIKKARATF